MENPGGGGTTARTAGINTISQKINAELNKVNEPAYTNYRR